MEHVPTRQVVRLSEVPHMITARLDFSSCRNTLVGYTDNNGDYIVKSYKKLIGALTSEGMLWVEDEPEAYDEGRCSAIQRGFESLLRREARVAS